jgi:hypothetical protein
MSIFDKHPAPWACDGCYIMTGGPRPFVIGTVQYGPPGWEEIGALFANSPTVKAERDELLAALKEAADMTYPRSDKEYDRLARWLDLIARIEGGNATKKACQVCEHSAHEPGKCSYDSGHMVNGVRVSVCACEGGK